MPDPVRIGVAEFHRLGWRPFSDLEQGQQFTEDLRGIPAVDLLDHDDERHLGIPAGGLDGLQEQSIDQGELALPRGPPSPDEVLVGQVGVELHDPDRFVVTLPDERMAGVRQLATLRAVFFRV